MAESNDQSKSDISVSIDNLEDIILPRLNTFSPAQWTLLLQGIRDSHITSIMADIVVNIYKQSVENSLKVLAPVFEQNMATTSYVKSEVPEKTVSVHLTSLISTEIATALQVLPEVCRSGVELNSLMEEEVSRKVTAFANAIQKAPDYPVEPAVYVSGCFSNLRNFSKMVSHTVECLRRDLNRARTKCVERYWTEFTRMWASGVPSPKPEVAQHDVSEKGVSQRIKPLISLPSVCENISEIIEKYTHDSGNAKTSDNVADVLPIDPFKTDEVTEEICQTILEDLHYCKSHDPAGQTERTCPCTPHFNLKKIAGYLKDFYSSNLKTDPVGKQEIISKPEYSRFVEKQFTDMVSSLEKLMDSSDTKVVKLKHKPHRLKRVLFSLLPGCIPEVSSDEESPKPLYYTETDYFPKLDFQAVKPKIVSLCAECMENPDLQDRIKMFKRDLTDKLYVHIMKKHYHKIPVPPKGKCLSDCVFSSKKIRDISGEFEISPEIIYVRVEDSVGTFFQNIFLWIRHEETDHITHSDRVSNVLSEINDMVGQLCPSLNKRPLESEWDSVQVIGSAFTDHIDLNKEDQISFKSHTDSLVLVHRGSSTKRSSSHRFTPSGKITTHVDDKIQTNVKYPESIEAIKQTNKELEEAMACFVMNAVLDCLKENGGPLEFKEMADILSSLSGEKVDRLPDFTVSIHSEKIKHFVNEIYNHLKKQFGSAEAVWEAATSQAGRPFTSAVLRYLRSKNPNEPPKNPIYRFFLVITKPFTKLFLKQRGSSTHL